MGLKGLLQELLYLLPPKQPLNPRFFRPKVCIRLLLRHARYTPSSPCSWFNHSSTCPYVTWPLFRQLQIYLRFTGQIPKSMQMTIYTRQQVQLCDIIYSGPFISRNELTRTSIQLTSDEVKFSCQDRHKHNRILKTLRPVTYCRIVKLRKTERKRNGGSSLHKVPRL